MSIILASHALIRSGVPINRVLKRIRQTRREHCRSLRDFFQGQYLYEGDQDYEETRLSSVSLEGDAFAVGKIFNELVVDNTGAEVMEIRRHGIKTQEPSPDMRFETGDVVMLFGVPESLVLAKERLLEG
jgi:CPA2 family monovalent cation:H+ antiporter-2